MDTGTLDADVGYLNGNGGGSPPLDRPVVWQENATGPGATEAAGVPAAGTQEDDPSAAASETADLARLAGILESLLFAAGAPVQLSRLVEALDGPDRREVAAALRVLAERCEADGRGIRVVHVAGGYQLRTALEHGPWVRRLLGQKPPRLSRPMLETLAVIAYRQPCTKLEIEAVRGVDADAVLTTLMERRLVRIIGRKEAPGRPLLYATTREFLEVFGLPDLDALPTLKDLGDGAELLAARDLTVGPDGVVPTTGASDEPAATDGPAVPAEDDPPPGDGT
jgi:segregation and condensation protein B